LSTNLFLCSNIAKSYQWIPACIVYKATVMMIKYCYPWNWIRVAIDALPGEAGWSSSLNQLVILGATMVMILICLFWGVLVSNRFLLFEFCK